MSAAAGGGAKEPAPEGRPGATADAGGEQHGSLAFAYWKRISMASVKFELGKPRS